MAKHILIQLSRWFFGVVFLLFSLVSIKDDLLNAFIGSLLACVFIPPFYKFVEQRSKIILDRKAKIILVVVLFLAYVMTASSNQPETVTNQNNPTPTTVQIETKEVVESPLSSTPIPTISKTTPNYTIYAHEKSAAVENVRVIMPSTAEKTVAEVKKVAVDVKKNVCTKQNCNIDIYDDAQAAKLQTEYNKLMGSMSADTPAKLDNWKKQNYIFVADHNLAFIDFGDTENIKLYPLKDWYYKELKGN